MNYRDLVISEGNRIFGERFPPVNKFMLTSRYVSMFSLCSVAIIGHLRQQALDNIFIMIYLGAKVFLDRRNPIYEFLKKQHASIFTLENITTQIDYNLSKKEIEFNRNILRQHWSREALNKRTIEFIQTVRSQNA